MLHDPELTLKNFYLQELSWLAERDYQIKAWSNATGEYFETCLMAFTYGWQTIADHRNLFRLTNDHYAMFKKIHEMIWDFRINEIDGYPLYPMEYKAVLNNPEWKKIQEYAKEIKYKLAPFVKQ